MNDEEENVEDDCGSIRNDDNKEPWGNDSQSVRRVTSVLQCGMRTGAGEDGR